MLLSALTVIKTIVSPLRFYCPQAFLSLDFQCRDDVFESTGILGLKRAMELNLMTAL